MHSKLAKLTLSRSNVTDTNISKENPAYRRRKTGTSASPRLRSSSARKSVKTCVEGVPPLRLGVIGVEVEVEDDEGLRDAGDRGGAFSARAICPLYDDVC